jgi:Resolvase, N terminal domain
LLAARLRQSTRQLRGVEARRFGANEALNYMRPRDTLVFWKLDRVSRSLQHLIALAQDCKARDIGLRSLQDQIDTSSGMGRFFYHIMGAIAELGPDQRADARGAGGGARSWPPWWAAAETDHEADRDRARSLRESPTHRRGDLRAVGLLASDLLPAGYCRPLQR